MERTQRPSFKKIGVLMPVKWVSDHWPKKWREEINLNKEG